MKVNDAVWGALFALLGAAIPWRVQGFPRIPGQNVGPALFPGVLAVAMLVCGAILIARGLKGGALSVPPSSSAWRARPRPASPSPAEGRPRRRRGLRTIGPCPRFTR